ncbi:MAG TPA: hypothetical protein VFV38_28090 [Ktedonobacteraceae bacterium]|nr:hypothetical protein [Ktedonobacteraceae bacterium]
MAQKKIMTPLGDKQVQDVESLLHTLKEKANDAYQAGDVYMNTVYAELVKVVSPIVVRAHARMHREDRARINKNAKSLRKGEKSTEATA